MELSDDGMCFACGPRNPIGLKLEFELTDGKYTARFIPRPEHQGYEGVTHGGIISTLLDEAMARLVHVLGHNAVTAEMCIRLKKPARTGEELVVSGWVTSEQRRVLECAAEARDSSGAIVAQATGKMVKV